MQLDVALKITCVVKKPSHLVVPTVQLVDLCIEFTKRLSFQNQWGVSFLWCGLIHILTCIDIRDGRYIQTGTALVYGSCMTMSVLFLLNERESNAILGVTASSNRRFMIRWMPLLLRIALLFYNLIILDQMMTFQLQRTLIIVENYQWRIIAIVKDRTLLLLLLLFNRRHLLSTLLERHHRFLGASFKNEIIKFHFWRLLLLLYCVLTTKQSLLCTQSVLLGVSALCKW